MPQPPDDEARPNPLTALRRDLEQSGRHILDLTRSNPAKAGITCPERAVLDALAQPESLVYEPDPAGLPKARQSIAGYCATRGRRAHPDDIVLTAGTSEAYAFLFKLLCRPGDEILVPTPSYPLLDCLAELEHVRLVKYPLRYSRGARHPWVLERAGLEGLVSSRTRALVLIHPGNPTGRYLSQEEAGFCLDLARNHGLSLIVDEVFRDYPLQGGGAGRDGADIHADDVPTFTLNGLSKLLGLPQLKLAWILMDGPPERMAAYRHRLEYISDAFLSVNGPVQHACHSLMELREALQAPIRRRLGQNLDISVAITEGSARLHPLVPEGGWHLILELESDLDDEAFACRLLEGTGVYAYPGYFFDIDLPCALVVSLLTPPDEFRRGLEAVRVLAETCNPVGSRGKA